MSDTHDDLLSHPANAWLHDPGRVARARQVQEDLAWAREHYGELEERYRGEYVAVWRKGVVGHGADLGGLLASVVKVDRPREELAILEIPAFLEHPR